MSATRIRLRISWLITRHLLRTMPWIVLIVGCLSGIAALLIIDHTSRFPPDADQVRLTWLPPVAALCFVPHVSFRPLIQTAPVPTWLAAAGHTLLAAPLLAATCSADLLMMTARAGMHSHEPAVYPLAAQFVGWCALAVLAATCCDRTHYATLNGVIAAPISLAVITLTWTESHLRHVLISPGAHQHTATVAWYAIAAVASAATCVASRDSWHRYARLFTKLVRRCSTSPPERV